MRELQAVWHDHTAFVTLALTRRSRKRRRDRSWIADLIEGVVEVIASIWKS